MRVAAIIAEYNPFHNGHAYQIQRVRDLTEADYVLVIMSGDFVQRGTPAIIDKFSRTEMALYGGADAVIELPVRYACGSAEYFATGAVSIFDALGCVDYLCFGCEDADRSEDLQKMAVLFNHESDKYKEILQNELKNGISFPKARIHAVESVLDVKEAARILQFPNNILALEYLRALDRTHSSIKPVFIQRVGAGYHETDLSYNYASASAIRNAIEDTEISPFVPQQTIDILNRQRNRTFPVELDDFSQILHYLLLRSSAEDLEKYQDIHTDLANKMIKNREYFQNISQYCMILKSKDITYSRISRSLLHIILNIQEVSFDIDYTRLLGLRKDSASLLSVMKAKSQMPIITKLSDISELDEAAQALLNQDIFAANVYSAICTNKFGTEFRNEYKKPIIII